MLFVILAIIEVSIIVLSFILFKKLKLTKMKKLVCIVAVAVIIVLVFVLFRFVTSLLVFDSPEKSVKASSFTPLEINQQIDVDEGAFLICNQTALFGNSNTSKELHSVLKRGDSWSSLDVNNSSGGFITLKDTSLVANEVKTDDGKRVSATGLYLYNSEMDKTILQLDFFVRPYSKDRSDFEVKDGKGNSFCFYESGDSLSKVYHSYLIVDGEADKNFRVYINGKEALVQL